MLLILIFLPLSSLDSLMEKLSIHSLDGLDVFLICLLPLWLLLTLLCGLSFLCCPLYISMS